MNRKLEDQAIKIKEQGKTLKQKIEEQNEQVKRLEPKIEEQRQIVTDSRIEQLHRTGGAGREELFVFYDALQNVDILS